MSGVLRGLRNDDIDANDTRTMDDKFADEEEVRARQNPAPPLWDENLADEYVDTSYVFNDYFKNTILSAWRKGGSPSDCTINTTSGSLTIIGIAIHTVDIPLLNCIGRYNVDWRKEIVTGKMAESTNWRPLTWAISMCRKSGSELSLRSPTTGCVHVRSRVAVCKWILSRGCGDPNEVDRGQSSFAHAICNQYPYSESTLGKELVFKQQLPSPSSLLHHYFCSLSFKTYSFASMTLSASHNNHSKITTEQRTTTKNTKQHETTQYNTTQQTELGKLMLDYGGDPATLSKCTDSTIRRALEVYQSIREKRGTATTVPPPLCPCGADVAVELCHGAAKGVPLHDRQHCFCRSGKIYRKCCKKRRFFFRESLEKEIHPPRFITDPSAVKLLHQLVSVRQSESVAAGDTPEQAGNRKLFQGLDPAYLAEQHREIYSDTAMNAINAFGEKRIDKCFLWVLKHPQNDFGFARLWRKPGSSTFGRDKTELALRRDQ